jgi:glycosyltransferase involved in cell wall biosynthesis
MRILYHHRIRSKDGQYVHLSELVSAMRALGHDVRLCGPSAVEKEQLGADAGFIATLKRHAPKSVYELAEVAYSVFDLARLALSILVFKPDAIYERYNLNLLSGIWARRLTSIPLALEVNAPLYEERRRHDGIALQRLAAWSESYCWRGADIALPVTNVLANRMRALGVPESRIHVTHNAINPADFANLRSRELAKASLGLTGRLVLGFVGFVREWHGLDRVIRLLREPNFSVCSLLVVGDGPDRQRLQRVAHALGVSRNVHFTGTVDRDQIPAHISAFDIALQPDVVDYASPLKIFEYMAVGRAIIAPDRPNIREILKNEVSALLFEPSDEATLHHAIERLVESADLRFNLELGAAAVLRERNVSWESNARKICDLLALARPGRIESIG